MELKDILLIFLLLFIIPKYGFCDIEDLDKYILEPLSSHKELLKQKPWLFWNQKIDENRYIKMHEADLLFNVTVKDRTFMASFKDLCMWLKYTQKLIVINGKSDDILKKFLKIYTNIYKFIYKGVIKYIHGESSAAIMAEFEQLGMEVDTTPNYDKTGDCNFIRSVLDKFANNNTMFILTNVFPNNYIINRLNIHMQHYTKLRMLVLTKSVEWNPYNFHYLTIENYVNKHYQHNRRNTEFLSPPGISDVEYLKNLKAPEPKAVEDFVAQFINSNTIAVKKQ